MISSLVFGTSRKLPKSLRVLLLIDLEIDGHKGVHAKLRNIESVSSKTTLSTFSHFMLKKLNSYS